jgi:hypothetical protein
LRYQSAPREEALADQADLIRDLVPNLKPVCSKSTGHSLRKQVFLEAR